MNMVILLHLMFWTSSWICVTWRTSYISCATFHSKKFFVLHFLQCYTLFIIIWTNSRHISKIASFNLFHVLVIKNWLRRCSKHSKHHIALQVFPSSLLNGLPTYCGWRVVFLWITAYLSANLFNNGPPIWYISICFASDDHTLKLFAY